MLEFTVAENEIISNAWGRVCAACSWKFEKRLLAALAVAWKAMPFRVSIGRDSVFRLPDKLPTQLPCRAWEACRPCNVSLNI